MALWRDFLDPSCQHLYDFQLDSWKERFLGWVTECVQDANINSGSLTVRSMAGEARVVADVLLDLDSFGRLSSCELLDSLDYRVEGAQDK